MLNTQRELLGAARGWLHDRFTISEAAAYVDANDKTDEPLRALKSALAAGLIRSSGEIDGSPRRELGIVDWIDYAIVRAVTGIVDVRSIKSYPRSQVKHPVLPETFQGRKLIRRGADGVCYHRLIEGVLVSAEDVRRVWFAGEGNVADIGLNRTGDELPSACLKTPTTDRIAAEKSPPKRREGVGGEYHYYLEMARKKAFPNGKIVGKRASILLKFWKALTEIREEELAKLDRSGIPEGSRPVSEKTIDRYLEPFRPKRSTKPSAGF